MQESRSSLSKVEEWINSGCDRSKVPLDSLINICTALLTPEKQSAYLFTDQAGVAVSVVIADSIESAIIQAHTYAEACFGDDLVKDMPGPRLCHIISSPDVTIIDCSYRNYPY